MIMYLANVFFFPLYLILHILISYSGIYYEAKTCLTVLYSMLESYKVLTAGRVNKYKGDYF